MAKSVPLGYAVPLLNVKELSPVAAPTEQAGLEVPIARGAVMGWLEATMFEPPSGMAHQ